MSRTPRHVPRARPGPLPAGPERLECRTTPSGDPVGDTLADALLVALTPGTAARVAGAVEAGDDVDLYAVDLVPGSFTAVIDADRAGSPLDSYLRLFDADGTELAAGDDSFYGSDSFLVFPIPAGGRYYLGVSGFGNTEYDPTRAGTGTPAGSTGPYTLTVEGIPAAAVRNDTIDTARPLDLPLRDGPNAGPPVEAVDAIGVPGAVHLYAVPLAAGDAMSATVDTSNSPLDSYLRVFGPDGNELGANDDDGSRDYSRLTVLAPVDGTYFVGISSFDNVTYDPAGTADRAGDGFGPYRLRLDRFRPTHPTRDTAQPVVVPVQTSPGAAPPATVVSGRVSAPGGVQLYAVRLDPGDVLDATVDATDSALDPYLRVFAPDGTELAANDDAESNDFSRQGVRAAVGGVYYVGVSSTENQDYDPDVADGRAGDGAGSFTLELVRRRGHLDGDDGPATARPLPPAPGFEGAVAGTIDHYLDVDFYSVELAAGDLLRLTLDTTLVGSDLIGRLRVFGGSGEELGSAGDSTERGGPAPGLEFRSAAAGRYLIGVSSSYHGDDYDAADVLGGRRSAVSRGAYRLRYQTIPGPTPGVPQLASGTTVTGGLTPAEPAAVYEIATEVPGRLVLRAAGVGGAPPRLTLAGPAGAIVTADALPTGVAVVDLHLTPGRYTVTVSGGPPAGNFRLTADLTPANAPSTPAPVGDAPVGLVVGDWNLDGIPDLAAGAEAGLGVAVLLGLGDGSFAPPRLIPVGGRPVGLAAGHFDRDGHLDLAVLTAGAGGGPRAVVVLTGLDGGAFAETGRYPAPAGAAHLAAGDLDGNWLDDLAYLDGVGGVGVLLNRGDATFAPARAAVVGGDPRGLAVGDFDRDGQADLAVVDGAAGSARVLFGRGDGTFRPGAPVPVGGTPVAAVARDLNRDGVTDLVAVNNGSENIGVLLGRGDGTFAPAQYFPTGLRPEELAVGDFDGDGVPDVATSGGILGGVFVLPGNGDGTFGRYTQFGSVASSGSLALADLDRDGLLDVAVTDLDAKGVTVLPGLGHGRFHDDPGVIRTGQVPAAVGVGDFNRDGVPDLAVVNRRSDQDVSVLLGNGDGTYQDPLRFPVGSYPDSVTVRDFNGDGRLDLVTANLTSDDVTVLLGLGDGRFAPGATVALSARATAAGAGDFNHDGVLDLAVAAGDAVVVLTGDGRGGFSVGPAYPVGEDPDFAVAVADFDGDGSLDVATGNNGSGDVSVLFGRPDGTFRPEVRYRTGSRVFYVSAGDVNGDGLPDLAVADYGANDVVVLLSRPDQTFRRAGSPVPVTSPECLVVADVTGDGIPDLVTAGGTGDSVGEGSGQVTVFPGNGDGTFQPGQEVAGRPDLSFLSLTAADLDGDGRTDLAVGDRNTNSLLILLNQGGGLFLSAGDAPERELQPAPVRADLDGDRVPDFATVDAAGRVLFRRGLPGATPTYAPPIITNPGFPVRDIRVVRTATGPRLVGLPVAGGPVALFSADGRFTLTVGPNSGGRPAAFAAADLDGDGLDDLAIGDPGTGQLLVYSGTMDGGFGPATAVTVGAGPVAVAAADLDGDGASELVVLDQFTGQADVIRNLGGNRFAAPTHFRGGPGPAGLTNVGRPPAVRSQDRPEGAVAGRFGPGGAVGLVVAEQGADRLALLAGAGAGGLAGPAGGSSWETGRRPGSVVAADFNGDGHPDAALLNRDDGTASVFLGDGNGGLRPAAVDRFGRAVSVPVGDLPVGVAAVDASGPDGRPDGIPDLVVGNVFGDVLVLVGRGDGTFAPDRGLDVVPLTVTRTPGDPAPRVLLADRRADSVSVQARIPGTTRFTPVFTDSGRQDPDLLAPGAVTWADLGDGPRPSALVASGGGNRLLVYTDGPDGLRLGGSYPTGTNPAGMAVGDLTGDPAGAPDVAVANAGSDDVTILVGSVVNGRWVGTPGPRLRVGAGPNAVAIRDVDFRTLTRDPAASGPDGVPDLVVTNGADGTVSYLRGLGGGFFDDAARVTVPVSGGVPIDRTVLIGGRGFVLAGGGVRVFDVETGQPGSVLVPAGVRAFDVVLPASGTAFVATGSVGDVVTLFPLSPDGVLGPALTQPLPADAALSELDLFPSAAGVDAYLTAVGQDAPFVVSFDLNQLLPGAEAGGDALSPGLTPLGEAGIALVATLVSGGQPSPALGRGAPSEGEGEFAAGFLDAQDEVIAADRDGRADGYARVVELFVTLLLGTEDEAAPVAEPLVPPELEGFLSGAEEVLRALGLRRSGRDGRTEEGAGGSGAPGGRSTGGSPDSSGRAGEQGADADERDGPPVVGPNQFTDDEIEVPESAGAVEPTLPRAPVYEVPPPDSMHATTDTTDGRAAHPDANPQPGISLLLAAMSRLLWGPATPTPIPRGPRLMVRSSDEW